MAEELLTEEVAKKAEEKAVDEATKAALDELEKLRDNSVPKEDYDKLKEANADLTRRLAKDRPLVEEQKVIEPTNEDLYNKIKANSNAMAEGNLSGYEYAKLLIENEDLMNKLGIDYFQPNSEGAETQRTRNEATSKLLRECLDDCEGDPQLFNSLMESRTFRDR